MKKVIILLAGALIFHMSGLAQFPVQYLFPSNVSMVPFADTLLNTRAIIISEGIKKITAYWSSGEPGKTYSTTTTYLKNGNISVLTFCFPGPKNGDSSICVDHTVLYDHKGRMMEL